MRPGNFGDRLKRFAVRVSILSVVYLLPSLFDLAGAPMTEVHANAVREVAAVGIVWATAAWASTQGRRRPEGES
jgi:hypothetical protein